MSKGLQHAPSLGPDSTGKSELSLPSVRTQFRRVLPSATFFRARLSIYLWRNWRRLFLLKYECENPEPIRTSGVYPLLPCARKADSVCVRISSVPIISWVVQMKTDSLACVRRLRSWCQCEGIPTKLDAVLLQVSVKCEGIRVFVSRDDQDLRSPLGSGKRGRL